MPPLRARDSHAVIVVSSVMESCRRLARRHRHRHHHPSSVGVGIGRTSSHTRVTPPTTSRSRVHTRKYTHARACVVRVAHCGARRRSMREVDRRRPLVTTHAPVHARSVTGAAIREWISVGVGVASHGVPGGGGVRDRVRGWGEDRDVATEVRQATRGV